MRINAFHRAVLKRYADGDFAHLIEQEEVSSAEIDDLDVALVALEGLQAATGATVREGEA